MASSSVAAPSQGAQPSFNPGLTYQPRHQYIPRPRLDTSPGGHHGSYFRPRHHRFQPRFPPNSTVADDGSISYDGKRMRKAIHRKTVDYNPSVFKYLQNRVWQRDRRDEHQIQPDALYLSDLLPPTALIEKPMNCVTTKFVRTSTNKFRCPVFCLSWTPEGRRLVTGASSGEFTLWNGLTFNFETILQAHETAVRAMKWSHSDTWMITADHAGYIKYWQSNMNNVKMYQAHKEPIRGISFCPSDSKFASCSDDGSVRVWDFMRCHEERVLRGHGADVRCVDWHPQKGLIASGSKDNQQPIKLWDPRTGNSLATMHAHKHTVMDLKWHQNGTWLLTASRDHLVKLFDIRKLKEEMQTFKGHKREATAVAWHPIHEGLFASGSADGALMFWMVGCDHEVGSMEEAHEGMIWDLAWHPLGHILASGSNDHSTKFWTRNRPGDKMRDKYNLNNLPQGMMETEMLEYSTAEPSAMPSLPGMGLEHGLPDHLIKDEDREKEETNELPSIPGLDWEADEAFLKAEERAALKKVPYSRPVPKVFEQAWSGEIDLEAMKKEQQDKEQIQKKIQAQLNMKKNQPNLLLAAQQMLGALAGSLRQHLSVSEATRMLIPGPPIMMRPQGPRVILAPGQSVMRPPPPNQMVFVPGGPGQKNSNGDPNNGGMENASDSSSSSNQHQGPGSQGQMRLLGSARPPHGPMGGPQMGPQGDPQNQMGPPGGPQNQFGPPGGPQRQMGGPQNPMGGPQNQMGPPGGPHNQMGGPQRQMGGPQNQMGPQGGPQNQMGPPGGPQNQFGPQGGPQNQMGGPQNQMGGPQNQMGGPQNQMGGPQSQMGGPQNQMGGPQNQMGGPQNQMGGPQNQMGGPQNQMGGPQNQMGGPQNQMGGPQDQFQQQMGGPWGEMEDSQTQDFGHGGPNQFGGPQGQMGNQWNQGQYQMGGPPEGQHDHDMDKDDRMGSQRNAPFSGPGQAGGMLEGGQGIDEDFRGSGGYDGGMNQMGGDDQSYIDEDQDYRHMGGRNDRGGGGGGGHRSGGHQHQQQRGEEQYQRGGPNQRRHDGGGFGGAYDGDEEYDSRYQNNRHRGRGGGGGGGGRGGGGGGGRGGGRGKGDGYRGRGRGRSGGQNDDGDWDDEGHGHEDQEQWRNDYEDDYDEGGYGRYDDQGSGAKRGRKRQWGDEGPGGGPGNRGRGRGSGGRGRSRGGRGSSYRGNRGAGRGGRGWGRGGERGGGGRGRARGGY